MHIALASPPPLPEPGCDPVRVMVVDDSIVVRGLLARWIRADPELQFVGSMRSGREAIEALDRLDPHVVVLDIDMPDIDGITALPRLLEKRPDLTVIMASTLTLRNAQISLRALALGAADYVPKPQVALDVMAPASFRRELIGKIKGLASVRQRRVGPAQIIARTSEAGGHNRPLAASPPRSSRQGEALRLRPWPASSPRAVLVGASTGGPQALQRLLTGLAPVIEQMALLVVQHMPATFTTVLAEQLMRETGLSVHEAADGEDITAGRVLLAPGGRHMRVVRRQDRPVIALDDGAPINFCKPAVDPLFASAAQIWGARTLAIVLTGMGSDGTSGSRALVDAGGAVIAQDQDSSVVWGMPASVAQAGLCSAVLPLDQIAARLVRLLAGEGR
ncbi:MAG: chemotaxis response regulator protein-glutamate methylesterase [Hyphomicrobiales bacterium]|nr:chemotaxis response regulator protein-glutamate methylesterase [Hyphomicrobiales bacterium]